MSQKLYILPLNLVRYSLSRNTCTVVWKWKHANYFPLSQMNAPEGWPCLSWGFVCPGHVTMHVETTVSQTKWVLHVLSCSSKSTRSQCFLKFLKETKHQLTSVCPLVPVREINSSYQIKHPKWSVWWQLTDQQVCWPRAWHSSGWPQLSLTWSSPPRCPQPTF